MLSWQHTYCRGVFCGGEGLGHGEEMVTEDGMVGAELNQLHKLATTHLGVVDASLRRAIVITCIW